MRRTQIYLAETQAEQLAARARRRGTTSSHEIREAIDRYLAEPEDERDRRLARFRAALDDTFGGIPRLENGQTFVKALRVADTARGRDLADGRHP